MPLHLDALPRICEAQLCLVQSRVAPRQVPVQDVMELPALLGRKGHDPLDLLQRHEGVVSTILLHAHSAHLVQALDEPDPAAAAAEGHDAADHQVCLVDLVVLEVNPNKVKSHSQVSWLKERGSEFALRQLLCQVCDIRAISQGDIKDTVLLFPGDRLVLCSVFGAVWRGSVPVLPLVFLGRQPILRGANQLTGKLPLQLGHKLCVAGLPAVELNVTPDVAHHRLPLLRNVRSLQHQDCPFDGRGAL
mmetsp:Transcript_86551/g.239987  ORF Transcript_86551/g.239987 Transcript_86551/m.239987 type:complete len:247 (+) Transcript_86551:1657-2397(+)